MEKKSPGKLEVRGTIELKQLWPEGSGDADTLHLTVNPESFLYQKEPSSPLKTTRVFEGATVVGRVKKPAIHNGRITVRLQGADVAELHYTPTACVPKAQRKKAQEVLFRRHNGRFRQPLAETATRNLSWLLLAAEQSPLPCRVVSWVDEPGEVFDTYGRLVGELFIPLDGREVSVNSWLLRQGWAFPAFYCSMTNEEIERLRDASEEARSERRGVWARYSDFILHLNANRCYRATPPRPFEEGRGKVIWPKLFRRLTTWAVNRRARMLKSSFREFLEASGDRCYLTRSFLTKGRLATIFRINELVGEDGFFERLPTELVLTEATSRLLTKDGSPASW